MANGCGQKKLMDTEAQRAVRRQTRQESGVTIAALFASGTTLICCALPIALVTMAGGAAVASLVGSVPFLIPLSQNKEWIFLGSAVLLGGSAWLLWRPGRACPTDPKLAKVCTRSQIWNRRVMLVSVGFWCLGFFSSYLALPLRRALDL